ncbi:MAG TPA: TetR/AcrR family transcriptional regulator [Candidatus Desulfobacillus sp.]|nr:TetR/AcrR family transcriptional regulator [Candidatus Desulfobacillus sp.]
MHPVESTPGVDTRERILDAAEALIVEHGLEAASLRMITRKAGANLAAANYHFGSKDGLVQAVFRRRLAWLNEARLQALDRLEQEAAGAPLKPHQIVEAFFGVPLRMAADSSAGGQAFMRLLGRTCAEPSAFVRRFIADEHAAVVPRFKQALFRALPDVPQEEILWRFHFMLGAMSYAISGIDALQLVAGADLAGNDPRALARRLMPFLLGGLRAPLPGQPERVKEKPPRRAA